MTKTKNISTYLLASLYDPTRTITLRRAFERAMNRRFNTLIQTITSAIIKDDCFGLTQPTALINSPGRNAFAFPRSADKVSGFMAWLDEQIKDGVLEISHFQQAGTSIDAAWTNKYISGAYTKGVTRARTEMIKAGYNVPPMSETGGIDASMRTPFHMDRVGVLWTRTFNELKGVTDAMSQQISRVLSQGMMEGDNPVLLGRKLAAVIKGGGAKLGINDTLGRYIPAKRRAQMIARTEIIRAHHSATIQEYRNWGLEGITVKAEWSTAGDNRVCDKCNSMDGHRYTLNQIENMIPAHPSCRCIALPVKVADKGKKAVPKTRVSEAANIGRGDVIGGDEKSLSDVINASDFSYYDYNAVKKFIKIDPNFDDTVWSSSIDDLLQTKYNSKYPIILDEHGLIIDGNHRYTILKEYAREHELIFVQIDSKKYVEIYGNLLESAAKASKFRNNSDYFYSKLYPYFNKVLKKPKKKIKKSVVLEIEYNKEYFTLKGDGVVRMLYEQKGNSILSQAAKKELIRRNITP